VLLLDEPLSNLDARLRLEMRAELKRIHQAFKTTVVFVTHDQWEAMTLATTIAVMSEGTLQQMGTPDDIYDRPANRFVAEFVGSPPINILTLDGGTRSPLIEALGSHLERNYPQLTGIGSVGIRPEAVRLAANAAEMGPLGFGLPMQVTGILPTGGNWIIELRGGGETLFMTTHETPEVAVGTNVHAWVKPKALHVFDRDGRRIDAADRMLRVKTTSPAGAARAAVPGVSADIEL
jgi:iron(III) transport system ATP-binding protein